MTESSAILSATTARLLTWLERYVLGALFLLFAWQQGYGLLLGGMVRQSGAIDAPGGAAFPAAALTHWLLLLFNLFVGLMLLLGRRPVRPPRSARELFVPLLATFLLMALNLATGAWGTVGGPLVPVAWRAPLASLAALSTALGYAIALWGALALGRSFGVYVAVREVVLRGAYRWVRHPIYTGYLFVVMGLLLAEPRALTLAVATAFVAVMVYRARLEETALGDASEAYRRYRAEVGFLLPRLRRQPPVKGSRTSRT